MTDQHRATPEQWADQERWAHDDADSSCILELRARVEALEKAQSLSGVYGIVTPKELTPAPGEQWHVRVDGIQHGPMPAVDRMTEMAILGGDADAAERLIQRRRDASAAGSLVERVANAIYNVEFPHHGAEARAAIREVAAWLESESEAHLGSGKHWAVRMRSEANR